MAKPAWEVLSPGHQDAQGPTRVTQDGGPLAWSLKATWQMWPPGVRAHCAPPHHGQDNKVVLMAESTAPA